jgi:hypothetical protein
MDYDEKLELPVWTVSNLQDCFLFPSALDDERISLNMPHWTAEDDQRLLLTVCTITRPNWDEAAKEWRQATGIQPTEGL